MPSDLNYVGLDGTRVKPGWFLSLQVHFPSKFRGFCKTAPTQISQRLPGQPPLQTHDDEEADEDDGVTNDEDTTESQDEDASS